MKIGIICAGDEELSPFLPLIKDCKNSGKSHVEISYWADCRNGNRCFVFRSV